MRRVLLLLPAVAAALARCGESPAAVVPLKREKLFGRWETVYFRVEMETYRGSDSSRTVEVNESNWESAMGLRAIRTYFWPDSTYNILHYDLRDSLVFDPSGRWSVKGDSVFMQDLKPKKGPVYSYRVKVHGEVAELSGLEDSDSDGARDDRYFSTLRKYRKH